MKHVTELDVMMAGARVGGLALDARGAIWFAYDAAWLTKGFVLSPMKQFALTPTPVKATNPVFNQLHGVFNDALPDGWGLLLMDRYLKERCPAEGDGGPRTQWAGCVRRGPLYLGVWRHPGQL